MILAAALKWLAGNWPRLALYAAIALCVGLFLRGIHGMGARSERAACEVEKRELAGQALDAWRKADTAGAVVEQEAQAQSAVRDEAARVIEKEVIRYVERKRMERAAAAAQHAGTAGGPAGSGLQPPAEPGAGSGAGGGECALDADGLRLWAAAGRGELPDAAGPHDDGGAAAARGTGLRPPRGLAGEPRPVGQRAAPEPTEP